MTQAALAERIGISRSVISPYERGHREPSLPTLERLVAATGHELRIEIAASPHTEKALPLPPMGQLLRRSRQSILRLATSRGAFNVRIFGSVARGNDGALSDEDLLVDLQPGTSLVDLMGLERELGELLGRDVDIVPSDSLKPRIREQILREAVSL